MDDRKQLELGVMDGLRDDRAQDELIALVLAVVTSLGRTNVAARMGWKETRLHQALREDERHVPARLLAVLARMDPEQRIPRFFAELVDSDLKVRDRRTPEEKLADFRAECLKRFGPAAEEAAGAVGL
jgi:hypothetical protein